MLRILVRVLFLTCVLPGSSLHAGDAPVAHPKYVLESTELRTLPKSASGREYLLYVALPYSWSKDSKKKYPVVYVTDGYWRFALMNGLYGALQYDKVVPEYITVGIGYADLTQDPEKLRTWELSPVRLGLSTKTGNADKFLQTIETEIIPFVESEYRGDPRHRVLAGSSFGGLFSLYAMLAKPDLFSGYIAASPSVQVGNEWIFNFEREFARSRKPIKARLFMSAAEYEPTPFVRMIARFHEQLSKSKHPGLTTQMRLIDGERHGGNTAEAMNRGLRFVFEPLAPEKGPM